MKGADLRKVSSTSEVWCDGKVRFGTHGQANTAARHSDKTKKLSAYACPKCHGWHVGSSSLGQGRHRRHDINKRRREAREMVE